MGWRDCGGILDRGDDIIGSNDTNFFIVAVIDNGHLRHRSRLITGEKFMRLTRAGIVQ